MRQLRRIDVGAFLRWWGAGLLACLPAGLRRLFVEKPSRLVVEVRDDEILFLQEAGGEARELGRYPLQALSSGELRERGRGLQGKAKQVVLQLPAARVLSKQMFLPAVAEANLRQVVGFELDRLTPFSADQVYYDVRVVQRQPAARRLQIEFVVAPRAVVDGIVQPLAAMGLAPDAVCVARRDPGFNLLPPEHRPQKGRGVQRLNGALAGLAVVLAAVAALLPLWQQRSLVVKLQPEVGAVQRQAEQVLQLRKELDDALASSQFLVQKKLDHPPVIELLNELTTLFPDGTWVEQLEIRGNELQVRGQSSGASELIALVESSPLFQNVTFRSPVTADPRSGRDRFHLSAQIAREP